MIKFIFTEKDSPSSQWKTEIVIRLAGYYDGKSSEINFKNPHLYGELNTTPFYDSINNVKTFSQKLGNSEYIMLIISPIYMSYILIAITNEILFKGAIEYLDMIIVSNLETGNDFSSDYLDWLYKKGIQFDRLNIC